MSSILVAVVDFPAMKSCRLTPLGMTWTFEPILAFSFKDGGNDLHPAKKIEMKILTGK
jgi:hypothetical protein